MSQKSAILLGALASVLSIPNGNALELTAPFLLENAQVLPSNVRNPRFINVFMSIDAKYGGTGQVSPLGNPLNKVVTWNDVVGLQKNEITKNLVKSTLQDMQFKLDGSPGATTGEVNTLFNVKVPALAIGLSKSFTFGVAIPIMNVSVSADTGFSRSTDGQMWVDQLSQLSVEQGNEAATKLNNSVNEKLTAYGYEPVKSKTVSGLGDIQMVGKYQVYQTPAQALSLKTTLVLPTGTPSNVDAALDIPTGDGRFQLGQSVIHDFHLPMDFKWNAFGAVMALLPNSMERRIPKTNEDFISADKETLVRQLGASLQIGTSIQKLFPSIGLVTGIGYNVQYLTATKYGNGSLYSKERYTYLEGLNPSQTLHSTTLMAGFSTVEWYQSKKFFYPMQANFTFSHPIAGRNVAKNDVFAGEVVLFF